MKKVFVCSLAFIALMFSSCHNFFDGENFLADLDMAMKIANAEEVTVTIQCDSEKRKKIVPQVGALTGGRKEGAVIELEFEESDDYIFDKWTATPKESVVFEDEKERKTKCKIVSTNENIVIEPLCIKKHVLTVNFLGEHGSTNPYEPKKYFSNDSFLLTYRAESDYGFTKWEILDSETNEILEEPPVKIVGTGTEVNVEVLTLESDMEITIKAGAVRRPSIISYSPDWSENGEDSSQTITVTFTQKMNSEDISEYVTIVNRVTQEDLQEYFSEPYFDEALTTLRINANKDKLLPAGTEIVVTISGELCDEYQIKLGSDFTWTYKVNGKGDITPGYFNELKMYLASNETGKYMPNKDVLFDKIETDFADENNLKTYNLVEKKVMLTGSVVDEGSGPDFVTWKLSKINNIFYPTENSREVVVVPERKIDSEFFNFSGQVAYILSNGTNPTIDLTNDVTESGIYKLSLSLTDKSSNVSDSNDFFFVYDVTAPEIMNLVEYRSLANRAQVSGNIEECKDFDKVVISICGYETNGTGIDKHDDLVITDSRYINENIRNLKTQYSYEYNFVAYDKAGNSKKFTLERDTTPLPHIDTNGITTKTFAKDIVKVTIPRITEDDLDYWKTEITVKGGQDFEYFDSRVARLDVNRVTSSDLTKYFITDEKVKEVCAFRKIENRDDYFLNFSNECIEFIRMNETSEIIKDLNFNRLNATLIITDYDFAGNKTETEVQIKSQMDIGMYYHMDGYWSYDNHGKDTSKYFDYPVGVIVDVDTESDDNTGTVFGYRIKAEITAYPDTGKSGFGQYNSSLDENSECKNFLISQKIAVPNVDSLTDPNSVSIDGYYNTYEILNKQYNYSFIASNGRTFWDVIQEENINMMNRVPNFKWYLPSVYEAKRIIQQVSEITDRIINITHRYPIACSNFYYDENEQTLKTVVVKQDGKIETNVTQPQTCFFAKVNPDW